MAFKECTLHKMEKKSFVVLPRCERNSWMVIWDTVCARVLSNWPRSERVKSQTDEMLTSWDVFGCSKRIDDIYVAGRAEMRWDEKTCCKLLEEKRCWDDGELRWENMLQAAVREEMLRWWWVKLRKHVANYWKRRLSRLSTWASGRTRPLRAGSELKQEERILK